MPDEPDPFGHFPDSPVQVLRPDVLCGAARYEAACIFALPTRMEKYVLDLRERWPAEVPRDAQLRPHLTLLYLGINPASLIRGLLKALADIARAEFSIRFCQMGVFRLSNARTNWHLTIGPRAPLRRLQGEAAAACLPLGWKVATRSMGERYIPHVTIWDQLSSRDPCFPVPLDLAPPQEEFRISAPFVVGRPMGAPTDV